MGVEGALVVIDGWAEVLKRGRDRTMDFIEPPAKEDLVPTIFAA